MLLTSLTLQNFRSYTKCSFSFHPDVTLIVGPNTVGKTNILEAIAMSATARSFRAEYDREVVQWGEEVGRVIALASDVKLELVITQGVVSGQTAPIKKYMVNGVPRRMIDFVGNLRVVLFWPQDLELVTDSPSIRRRYLDSVIIQVDREYHRNLLSYERGLRQRNKLLEAIKEGNAERSHLLFWDQLLIKSGGYITDARSTFIDYINNSQSQIANYQIVYDKSIISESRLAQYTEEEVAAKATLVGPHRDDMIFNVKSKNEWVDLSKYGSRGEQRLAVLWLKIAELAFIQERVGERPVLLLDDILSELDEIHQAIVAGLLTQQQTILTSADPSSVDLVSRLCPTRTVIPLDPQT